MGCIKILDDLDKYIYNELNDIEKRKLELHLMECEECRKEYKFRLDISECINEEVELPQNFHSDLMSKIKEIELENGNVVKLENSKSKKRFSKWMPFASVAAVAVVVFTASQFPINDLKDKSSYEMASESPTDMAPKIQSAPMTATDSISDESTKTFGVERNTAVVQNQKIERKIIKDYNLTLELMDFDLKLITLEEESQKLGGYVESLNVYPVEEQGKAYKNGNIVFKIPAENADIFIKSIEKLGNMAGKSSSVTDITDSYYDSQSRLKNYESQLARLRELYSKADTVEDMIKLEQELTRVTSDIELLKGQLRSWDSQIDYSSVYLSFIEVESTEIGIKNIDNTLLSRAKLGFVETTNTLLKFIENLFIWIVSKSLYLVGITIIAIFGVKKTNKILLKRGKKNEKNN